MKTTRMGQMTQVKEVLSVSKFRKKWRAVSKRHKVTAKHKNRNLNKELALYL